MDDEAKALFSRWEPMDDDEKARIRDGNFSEREIPTLILDDPKGLLDLLSATDYVVYDKHVVLAHALFHEYGDRDDGFYGWADLVTLLEGTRSAYELGSEAPDEREEAYRTVEQWVMETGGREDEADHGGIDVALGGLEEFQDDQDGTVLDRTMGSAMEETRVTVGALAPVEDHTMKTSAWRYLHSDFATWYRSRERLSHRYIADSSTKTELSNDVARLAELVAMSRELELCVSRLCHTNTVRFTRNASDPEGPRVVVWCKLRKEGCTSISEFQDLQEQIGFFILCLNEATGYTPTGLDLAKLRGKPIETKNSSGDTVTTFSQADYSELETLTDDNAFNVLPHRLLGLKDGFQFASNVEVKKLPDDFYRPNTAYG